MKWWIEITKRIIEINIINYLNIFTVVNSGFLIIPFYFTRLEFLIKFIMNMKRLFELKISIILSLKCLKPIKNSALCLEVNN